MEKCDALDVEMARAWGEEAFLRVWNSGLDVRHARLCGDTGLLFQFLSIFSVLVRRVVTPKKKVMWDTFFFWLQLLSE
jgi:hypothetical protein